MAVPAPPRPPPPGPQEPSGPVVDSYHGVLPYSFGSLKRFEQDYQGGNETRSHIRQQLLHSDAFTRFRPFRRRKDAVPIYVYERREQVQADICYLSQQERVIADNDGYKYVLVLIDVFTKWTWVYPLRRVNAEAVRDAFETRFLQECGPHPKTLVTDRGKEFDNAQFAAVCTKYNILRRLASPLHKCPVVERFNRTLQWLLYRQMEARGHQRWIDLLPEALTIYHHRRHRTIKMSPFQAEQNVNQPAVLAAHLERFAKAKRPAKPKYKVGQHVRILLNRMTPMRRGYHPTYTVEVYRIHRVHDNLSLPRYEIVPLQEGAKIPMGRPTVTFFENELSPVSSTWAPPFKMERILNQGQDDVTGAPVYLIKWKGYNEPIFNSWIPHAQFIQLIQYLSPVEQSILMGERDVPLASFPAPPVPRPHQ